MAGSEGRENGAGPLRRLRPGGLPDRFVQETRALGLARLRVVLILAIVLTPAFIPLDYFRLPDGFTAVVTMRLAACAIFVAIFPLTSRKAAEPWVVALCALTIAVIAAYLAGTARLTQGANDPPYLHQAMALVFTIMGTGLLFPFDGVTTLFLAGIPFLLQVLFTFDFDPMFNLPILTLSAMATLIASVGAASTFATRLSDYEARSSREALLQARSDLVAMLTHDIKNPLGVVSGYIEVLRDDADRSAEEHDILRRMAASNQMALMLAMNFLDVSKIEAGSVVVNRRPTDVRAVLERVVAHQRSQAEMRNIRLLEDVPADLPTLSADPALLDRVFANLFSNAIKFTPKGGSVKIAARREGDRLVVAVEDSGAGIPPDALERIFGRFASSNARSDSTGLGLYIVKTFTEAHGGSVFAANRGDGHGARVGVSLPVGG